MHLTLEVKRYHEFFWLRDIRGVHISKCCAECFLGGKDNRVYYGTLHKPTALIDIDVIEHPKAVAYYLCGLSAGFNYWQNTHIAFVPAPGETVFVDNHNIRVTITNARRIEFADYIIHRGVTFDRSHVVVLVSLGFHHVVEHPVG